MKRQFLRADTFRLSRIGKNRNKLKKWRRPRGKHNKLRLKRAGHPKQPGIGYGTPKKVAGTIKGLIPRLVHNQTELKALNKNNIAIIARVGAKKKLALLKMAEEMHIPVANAGGKK